MPKKLSCWVTTYCQLQLNNLANQIRASFWKLSIEQIKSNALDGMITKETIKKSDLASFLTKSLPLKFLHVSCETPGNFPFRYFSSPNGSLQYQNVKIEYLISFGTAIVIRSTILWNMGIKKLDFPSIAQTALVQKRPLLKKRPFAISKCYK